MLMPGGGVVLLGVGVLAVGWWLLDRLLLAGVVRPTYAEARAPAHKARRPHWTPARLRHEGRWEPLPGGTGADLDASMAAIRMILPH
jgi:hypothetical protein